MIGLIFDSDVVCVAVRISREDTLNALWLTHVGTCNLHSGIPNFEVDRTAEPLLG